MSAGAGRARSRGDRWLAWGTGLALAIVLFATAALFGLALLEGTPRLDAAFFVEGPDASMTGGGIAPALVGTALVTLLMTLAGVPVGVATGIWLAEYAPRAGRFGPRLATLVRAAVANLAGVPSIVFGLFGLGFFVLFVGRGLDRALVGEDGPAVWGQPGLLWASLTLAVLTLPVVIVTTEEALRAVPSSLREAALGVGATRLQTTLRVVLPKAAPGIWTGVVLAVGRGAGEVAPLLFTGAANYLPELPNDPRDPFMHLGYHVYALATQSPDVDAAPHPLRDGAGAARLGLRAQPRGERAARPRAEARVKLVVENLSVFYGDHEAVRRVSFGLPELSVTALIGPSGCGKSTVLRALDRMHDEVPEARVEGHVRLDGEDVYAPDVDAIEVRRRIGMVFQKPNPFPKSIFDNVAFGLRVSGMRHRRAIAERVEEALRHAALFDEVKDRLDQSALGLSGGQQQRLCIARALAVRPEVLLLDEPTSALDPIATEAIEALIARLRGEITMAIVTHSLAQARRVADHVAFFYLGELVEHGGVAEVLEHPRDERTAAYVGGRVG